MIKSYFDYEKESGSVHNRRCIDNTVTGSNCCVGYCVFEEHPGFLTKELRKQHDCLKKECLYYVAKPKNAEDSSVHSCFDSSVEETVKKRFSELEGVKIIDITNDKLDEYVVKYITISNDYPFDTIADELTEQTGVSIVLQRLKYSFENCIDLLFND